MKMAKNDSVTTENILMANEAATGTRGGRGQTTSVPVYFPHDGVTREDLGDT